MAGMHSNSRSAAFNASQALSQLLEGCAQMQLPITANQSEQLVGYLQLMAKWNPVYNLTAIRETDKMVSHHLLDSLAVLPAFEAAAHAHTPADASTQIMDVGTGGGLPGIVLAIMRPEWQLTLVDPVQKKTAFLTQVKAQLNLKNVTVINGKVEDLEPSQQFDLITSRAFASLIDFVSLSKNALKPSGQFIAMKGIIPVEEMDELSQALPQYRITQTPALHVPQLQAERHLIHIQPTI